MVSKYKKFIYTVTYCIKHNDFIIDNHKQRYIAIKIAEDYANGIDGKWEKVTDTIFRNKKNKNDVIRVVEVRKEF